MIGYIKEVREIHDDEGYATIMAVVVISKSNNNINARLTHIGSCELTQEFEKQQPE